MVSVVLRKKQCDFSFKKKSPNFKDAHSGLRQFLATGSPLKMMKNAFYFTWKVLFVLKISKFLSWEVKAIRQWKNHTPNIVENLLPDSFLKN